MGNILVTIDLKERQSIAALEISDYLNKADLTYTLEPKLTKALSEHYGVPVKIRVPAEVSFMTKEVFSIKYVVLIEAEDGDKEENVFLNPIKVY